MNAAVYDTWDMRTSTFNPVLESEGYVLHTKHGQYFYEYTGPAGVPASLRCVFESIDQMNNVFKVWNVIGYTHLDETSEMFKFITNRKKEIQ